MTKTRIFFCLAVLASFGVLALPGCNDDPGTTVQPPYDGGPPPVTGGGEPDGSTSDGAITGDGSTNPDGGTRDFSDFVKVLVNTQTNATSKPASVDGTFTDRQTQADYPPAFFQ